MSTFTTTQTILVSDGSGVMFQHRLRCTGNGDDSWKSVTTNDPERDTVQNGSTSAQNFLYQNVNSGGGNYVIDRNYISFDLSSIPSTATITAISVFLTTDTGLRSITDSDAEKLRLVKSTNDDSVTSPNGATTANAIDHSVNNGADVTMSASDNVETEFDLGSSNLFSYVVAQHTAGNRANMYIISKLEFDVFEDASASEPTAGSSNRSGIGGNTNTTTTHRPRIEVTFTQPITLNTNLNIKSGTLNIKSGTLKFK